MSATGTDDTVLQLGRAEVRDGDAQVRANPVLAPGTVVDRYEVRDVIGRGAMGIVYRARQRPGGDEVALKLCATDAAGDSCSLLCSLLVREGQAMARLAHPNLVAVHAIGQFNRCIFVAMEYVPGSSLRSWAAGAARPWRQRLDALLAAGRGLAAAHDGGVVHRDFKPDNVLIGHGGQVKVTDFGLARILGAPVGDAGPAGACGCGTGSGSTDDAVAGTPRYMAPEQLAGAPGDARSDQFGFAVTIAELVPDAPPAVAEALAPALAGDPAARYPRVAELIAALDAAAG
jgi:eukaryotic-like serine/threonine-protein kinase